MTSVGPAAPSQAPVAALAQEARLPPARPPGVTYACVLSIVLDVMSVGTGLAMAALSTLVTAAFSVFPFFFPFFGALGVFFVLLGLMWIAAGAVGIAAGVGGMSGAPWARWTMVVLFAIGGVMGLSTIILPALNGVAIFFLVNPEAQAWFDGAGRAS